jgi:hypothetical protein
MSFLLALGTAGSWSHLRIRIHEERVIDFMASDTKYSMSGGAW